MLYYSFECTMTNMEEIENYSKQRGYAQSKSAQSMEFYKKHKREVFIFLSIMREKTVTIGCIVNQNADHTKLFYEYLECVGLQVEEVVEKEIALNTLENLLRNASRNNYIPDDDEILDMLNIESGDSRSGLNIDDDIYEGKGTKRELLKKAKVILCENTLCPEIERIFQGSTVKATGHPVHYMVISDDVPLREEMVKILHGALYTVGRISSKRCTTLTFFETSQFSKQCLDNLYYSCGGGIIYLKLVIDDEEDSDVKKSATGFLITLCEIMRKYQNSVLTVFGLKRTGKKIKEMLFENLGNTAVVEIDEEIISGEKAKSYLKTLANRAGVSGDKALYRCVNNAQKGYLAADLNKEFNYWYSKKLKVEIYPQYKDVQTVSTQVKEQKPKGSAYSQLQKMIGLTEAKKVINDALNFFKAQKLFRQKGMSQDTPSMHMVFTGNPGTAKTTVARLFAQIMKENGLLSRGDLYEVGRSDLVGLYVGHTAALVKKRFKEAKGSVLFIDEAYSLVDDRNGSYGDEAINTIVQEMENNREDTVVIFAGYPDKMQGFLEKNPGLKSRIAFHVPFADYNAEELIAISDLIAESDGLTLTEEAKHKLLQAFDDVVGQTDFGNGRYARNLIEKARMAQAGRLVKMDFESVTQDDISTILADDIEIPKASGKQSKMGFAE